MDRELLPAAPGSSLGTPARRRRLGLFLVVVIVGALASFVTGAGAQGPLLGRALPFAVLAGSTVTNASAGTVVNGDLGVSPGTAVTGFPPGMINGARETGPMSRAAGAQTDARAAFVDLEDEPCTATLSGDLGNRTLTPGVYCFTSDAQLTGTLTLDFQGNPNNVFIFKIGSALTTASGSRVMLINEGDPLRAPCNVFWQVGSSATLGSTSVFVGTLIADQSITVNSGARVTGRLLALVGAVTLDNNVIDLPVACRTEQPTPIPTTAAPTTTTTAVAPTTTAAAPTTTTTAVAPTTTTVAPTTTTVAPTTTTGVAPTTTTGVAPTTTTIIPPIVIPPTTVTIPPIIVPPIIVPPTTTTTLAPTTSTTASTTTTMPSTTTTVGGGGGGGGDVTTTTTAPAATPTTAPAGVTTTALAGVTTTASAGVTTTAPAGVTTTAPAGVTTTAPAGVTTTASTTATTAATGAILPAAGAGLGPSTLARTGQGLDGPVSVAVVLMFLGGLLLLRRPRESLPGAVAIQEFSVSGPTREVLRNVREHTPPTDSRITPQRTALKFVERPVDVVPADRPNLLVERPADRVGQISTDRPTGALLDGLESQLQEAHDRLERLRTPPGTS